MIEITVQPSLRAQVVENFRLSECEVLPRRLAGLHHGDHDARHVVLPQLLQLGPDSHSPHALRVVAGLAHVRQEVERPGVLRASGAVRHLHVREEEVCLPMRLGGGVRDLEAGELENLGACGALRRALYSECERLCDVELELVVEFGRVGDQGGDLGF